MCSDMLHHAVGGSARRMSTSTRDSMFSYFWSGHATTAYLIVTSDSRTGYFDANRMDALAEMLHSCCQHGSCFGRRLLCLLRFWLRAVPESSADASAPTAHAAVGFGTEKGREDNEKEPSTTDLQQIQPSFWLLLSTEYSRRATGHACPYMNVSHLEMRVNRERAVSVESEDRQLVEEVHERFNGCNHHSIIN